MKDTMKTSPAANEYSDDENVNNNNNNINTDNHMKTSLPKPDIEKRENADSFSVFSSAAFALSCLVYMLYTTILLVDFLSGNANGILRQKHSYKDMSLFHLLVQDLWLILLFVLQHSIMAKEWFKNFMSNVVPSHLQRCFYILSTGVAIQILTTSWINTLPQSGLFLWDYSTSEIFCLTCQILHLLAWIHTIAVVFMLDFSEFVGLKQVYYNVNNFGCPMHAKTLEAQRFYGHFRHATVSGLLLIFWLVPCMTLDRLLLASVCTVYLFSTKIDNHDAVYVGNMHKMKIQALSKESSL